MSDIPTHVAVLIVGYGPAGAAAAALLGSQGHKILIIDRDEAIYEKPRAIALDHEILRLFDQIGILEAVLPHTAPFTASEHFGAQGQMIRRIDMVPPPYPMGYVPNMVFNQPAIEAVLRAHVDRLPDVTAALGTALHALDLHEDHAIAQIKDAQGRIHFVRADWVLGCDGASSTVRRLMGIALQDLIFDEPWLVVDILCNKGETAQLPATSAQFCTPARPISYIIGPGAHRRFEIMLKPGEDPKHMARPDQVWALLSRWITPAQGHLWRASAYRFHALVAQVWRRGPVFLAGDAAHQQPPFLGQGMCQGLRDIANLAWRLDRVMRGASGTGLLNSYETERKAHVTELTLRIKEIGAAICIQDPVAAADRDQRLLAQGGGQAVQITRQDIIPPLRVGLLSRADCPARGTLFPQPLLHIGGAYTGQTGPYLGPAAPAPVLMDKVIAPGWRLILNGHFAPGLGALALALPCLRVGAQGHTAQPSTLPEATPILAKWFEGHGVNAAILRPDHYVYATAATAADLQSRLAELASDPARPAGIIPLTGEAL